MACPLAQAPLPIRRPVLPFPRPSRPPDPARPPAARRPAARILLSPPQLTGGEIAGAAAPRSTAGWVAPAGPVPAAFEAALAAATGFPHHPRHHLRHRRAASRLPLPRRRAGRRGLDQQPHLRRHHRARRCRWAPSRASSMSRPKAGRSTPACWNASLPAPPAAAGCRGWWCRSTCSASAATSMPSLRALRPLGRAGAVRQRRGARRQPARPAGRPGARLAAFSFNGNKIVTTGGGGALASDDAGLIARARHLASQAKEPAAHYQHEVTGYHLCAVLGPRRGRPGPAAGAAAAGRRAAGGLRALPRRARRPARPRPSCRSRAGAAPTAG